MATQVQDEVELGGDPIQKPSTTVRGRGESQVSGQKRAPTTIDQATLQGIVSYVKKQRSRVVVKAEQLDILLLQAKFRHEHYRRESQAPADRKGKPARVTRRICELLSRKEIVVARVWTDYWNDRDPIVAPLPGNYFNSLKGTTVQNCIFKANQTLDAMYELVRRAEEGEDDSSEDSNSVASESDSSGSNSDSS